MATERRIPKFKAPTLGENSKLNLTPSIIDTIIGESFLAIRHGMRKRKKSITLYNIDKTEYNVDLERSEWKQTLLKACSHFEKKEEYEKCIQCQELINKL